MSTVTITIPKLIRFWNLRLPSQQLSTNPIVFKKDLQKIKDTALQENNEIEAIATFAHEVYRGEWGSYERDLLAYFAVLCLMEENQLGRYVHGGTIPLCDAFISVDSTMEWIQQNYDSGTF